MSNQENCSSSCWGVSFQFEIFESRPLIQWILLHGAIVGALLTRSEPEPNQGQDQPVSCLVIRSPIVSLYACIDPQKNALWFQTSIQTCPQRNIRKLGSALQMSDQEYRPGSCRGVCFQLSALGVCLTRSRADSNLGPGQPVSGHKSDLSEYAVHDRAFAGLIPHPQKQYGFKRHQTST